MKKFTTLMTVCSLVLAGAVMAQQPTPDESQPPGNKKEKPERKAPAELKPKATIAPKTEAPAVKEPAVKEPATNEAPSKHDKSTRKTLPAATPDTKTSAEPAATSTPPVKKDLAPKTSKKDSMKSPTPDAKASATAPPVTAKATATPATTKATATPATATASTTPATTASTTPAAATASATPATSASASAAPSISQTSPIQSVNPTAATKKLDTQKVQQIRQQHTSFHAQARPDRVPAVTFSANYRINGSDRWQGPQYEVYRSYHPERHDQAWYHSKYQRVELIGGGYYYFHNNYWYPAWGYNSSNEYYAYDAPIYVGKHAEPPDKVIADVQAALQEMGYYKGEVDGLLGPLTREALTGYQGDQGLTATAVIDEPTLDALGMG